MFLEFFRFSLVFWLFSVFMGIRGLGKVKFFYFYFRVWGRGCVGFGRVGVSKESIGVLFFFFRVVRCKEKGFVYNECIVCCFVFC